MIIAVHVALKYMHLMKNTMKTKLKMLILKSDIFSLGIIIFRLFYIMKTKIEMVQKIKEASNGIYLMIYYKINRKSIL